MGKINLMFLLSLILTISCTKLSSKNWLNQPRKLIDYDRNETYLLGIDNYTFQPIVDNKNNLSFNIYFLLKNWDTDKEINDYLNPFKIETKINYTDSKKNNTQVKTNFTCTKKNNRDSRDIKYLGTKEDDDDNEFLIVRFTCESDPVGGRPKFIDITTNFTKENPIKNTQFNISSSFEVFKRDLIGMKDVEMFDFNSIYIVKNSTILSKSSSNLKVKGAKCDYLCADCDSENIQLLTNSNGYPKKIPCSGKYKKDNSDDKYYYYLESKGPSNLYNTDLNYALLYYTKSEDILILVFQEGEKSVIEKENVIKKKSSGLSTGGMVAIIIPSVVVLLGVAGLAFFLSRRAVPPILVKNVANNTIGVASSEAVVHQ